MLVDLLVLGDAFFLVDGAVAVVVVLDLEDFEPSLHHLEVIVHVF